MVGGDTPSTLQGPSKQAGSPRAHSDHVLVSRFAAPKGLSPLAEVRAEAAPVLLPRHLGQAGASALLPEGCPGDTGETHSWRATTCPPSPPAQARRVGMVLFLCGLQGGSWPSPALAGTALAELHVQTHPGTTLPRRANRRGLTGRDALGAPQAASHLCHGLTWVSHAAGPAGESWGSRGVRLINELQMLLSSE